MSEKIEPTAEHFEVAALLLNSVHANLNVARAIARYEAERDAALAKVEAKPCQRCAVLEDLLETATSARDKARDEAAKADDEAIAHKVEMLRLRASGSREDYALVKHFQKRAETAEAELAKRGAKVVVEDASQ
jgi:deoxycytidylate deaminase